MTINASNQVRAEQKQTDGSVGALASREVNKAYEAAKIMTDSIANFKALQSDTQSEAIAKQLAARDSNQDAQDTFDFCSLRVKETQRDITDYKSIIKNFKQESASLSKTLAEQNNQLKQIEENIRIKNAELSTVQNQPNPPNLGVLVGLQSDLALLTANKVAVEGQISKTKTTLADWDTQITDSHARIRLERDKLSNRIKEMQNAEKKLDDQKRAFPSAEERVKFWDALDKLDNYMGNFLAEITNGETLGRTEAKNLLEKIIDPTIDPATGPKLKMGLDAWLVLLNQKVKEQASEFKTLKKKVDAMKSEDINAALKDFQTISKQATSSNTFTALWYAIGKNNKVPWGKDQEDAMKKVASLMSADNETNMLEIVKNFSKEYTVSRLLADARNLINKNENGAGYLNAFNLLKNPDANTYALPIKKSSLQKGTEAISVTWRVEVRNYWDSMKAAGLSEENKKKIEHVERELSELHSKRDMATAIPVYKDVMEIWFSEHNTKNSIIEDRREQLIKDINGINSLDKARVVWRELATNFSNSDIEAELKLHTTPKEFDSAIDTLRAHRVDQKFSGNDADWANLEALYRRLRQKFDTQIPPPVP